MYRNEEEGDTVEELPAEAGFSRNNLYSNAHFPSDVDRVLEIWSCREVIRVRVALGSRITLIVSSYRLHCSTNNLRSSSHVEDCDGGNAVFIADSGMSGDRSHVKFQ